VVRTRDEAISFVIWLRVTIAKFLNNWSSGSYSILLSLSLASYSYSNV
jgi:hypothetical protein